MTQSLNLRVTEVHVTLIRPVGGLFAMARVVLMMPWYWMALGFIAN